MGGLVGRNNGTINQAYATGNVVGHNRYIGGLVGSNISNTIQHVFSIGNVHGRLYVGGLVGNNDNGTIKEAYAAGEVVGESNVGGLAGEAGNARLQSIFVLNGKVEGTSGVGKAVGYFHNSIATNLSAISTMTGGGNDNHISYIISPEQALQRSTYLEAGFDFKNRIWDIDEGESLPYLVFSPYRVGYNPSTGEWIHPQKDNDVPDDDLEDPGNESEEDGDKPSNDDNGEDQGDSEDDQQPGQGDDETPVDDNPVTLRSPVAKVVDNSRTGVTIEANEVDNGLVYILKRKTGDEEYVEVDRQNATGTGKVTFTDTTIELKTTYSYVVEVQNGAVKATSNKVNVTTPIPEDEVPFEETPKLSVKEQTADSITLEGTAINRATEYILYRKQADGRFVEIDRKQAGESLIFTDTGLEEKTTYTYRLEATNGKVSAQSAPISVTTEALPPETPIIVTAKLVGAEPQGLMGKLMAGLMTLMGANDKPAVEVAWTEGEVKAQAFVVYRQEDGGAIRQVKTILSGQGNVFVDEKVKEGSTYVYYVEALKDGMRSDKAQSNPIEIPQTLTRGWAENPLTVVQEGDHVKISWVPAAGEVSKYFLYRIDTSNPIYKQSIAVLSGDVTEFVDTKVKKGRTYIYVIKAVYRDGAYNEHTDEFSADPITVE